MDALFHWLVQAPDGYFPMVIYVLVGLSIVLSAIRSMWKSWLTSWVEISANRVRESELRLELQRDSPKKTYTMADFEHDEVSSNAYEQGLPPQMMK